MDTTATAPVNRAATAPAGAQVSQPATAAAPAAPHVSAAQKLADTEKAIATLKMAGVPIPDSLTQDQARWQKEIKSEELKKKYDKLVEYLSVQATNISNLGLDLGDYAINISVAEKDGKKSVTVSAKGGVRTPSAGGNANSPVGKGRKVRVGTTEFPSAKAACDSLGLKVEGDSAVRVLTKNKIEFSYVD